ncbi:hypothetical protein [Legionella longbeachae]|uniref:Uncharacterized protein n=1 Tax=Legionella longbeachae serogroup 1 (strain NSW150) TaxID=661367 RepID=D3HLT2_LEGLN|nr:hypothetical protein [Legionella longbeachae]VEE03843.1 Uncharacterised protein [Legionella oakridgensis]ARB93296.1 hypothetical protein A6J40_14420 [Legionella longbeachae]EEZ93524.1 hypothetical protein LLB_2410 [Legionella longbeachae D-4968]QIN33511.1 hypothetical protein GCB94_15830 [Legionella longbeachae]QIN36860.1 hypothetical protein GCS73_15095 [Legionella longbeachae]
MLEKKESMLQPIESELVNRVRDKFINAFKPRSVNPSDFHANIACLKNLAQACYAMSTVLSPYTEKQRDTEHGFINVFFKDNTREELLKERGIADAAKRQMMEGVDPIIRAEMAKEPRIIGLNYYEIGRFYQITFSDNYKLCLYNLEPGTLAEAKEIFLEKMEALTAANSNTSLLK